MEDWLFGSVLSKRHVKDGVLWIASVTLLFLALSTSVFLPNLEFTIGLTGARAASAELPLVPLLFTSVPIHCGKLQLMKICL